MLLNRSEPLRVGGSLLNDLFKGKIITVYCNRHQNAQTKYLGKFQYTEKVNEKASINGYKHFLDKN